MGTLLLKNIRFLGGVHAPQAPLRGKALADFPIVENGFVLVEDDTIAACGSMTALEGKALPAVQTDCSGAAVLPCWCDSHTHIVYPASRESEFVDKIRGRSYEEIAANGGGILNSARKLAETSEDALFDMAWNRLQELNKQGTGTIEIKSGYGLTVEGELKMLRVIKKLKERSRLNIKATFLGAHTYPIEYRNDHDGYLKQIETEMLPVIAAEKLADYIDVFCETGFFSPEETERICRAGMQYGLKAKIHANQLYLSGGVETGIRVGAVSVDHLETMNEDLIRQLAASPVIGTLLPLAAYFLRMDYQPARQLIDAGAAIALASDYNPGSAPSGNMQQVISMSCIRMKMLPEEAFNAATINGAFAVELATLTGSIAPGKRADLILSKPVPSLAYIPYAFGSDHVEKVMVGGEWI